MSAFLQLVVLMAVLLVATQSMMVKTKVANPGNLCRKMKRIIKTSDAATFEKDILTPENDLYLREGCSGAIYSNLMEKVAKKALELKVTVKPGFGVKAIVVLPDLVEMAVAAGSFNVRWLFVIKCEFFSDWSISMRRVSNAKCFNLQSFSHFIETAAKLYLISAYTVTSIGTIPLIQQRNMTQPVLLCEPDSPEY